MKSKLVVFVLSILGAFIFVAAGYGLWEDRIIVKGSIDVIKPSMEATFIPNETSVEESQSGDDAAEAVTSGAITSGAITSGAVTTETTVPDTEASGVNTGVTGDTETTATVTAADEPEGTLPAGTTAAPGSETAADDEHSGQATGPAESTASAASEAGGAVGH